MGFTLVATTHSNQQTMDGRGNLIHFSRVQGVGLGRDEVWIGDVVRAPETSRGLD